MRGTFYLPYVGFRDPGNIDIDAKINFLSLIFAEICDIENSYQPFLKWLPQPPQTNIISILGFRDPEHKDKDTIVNFLSILFADIWEIDMIIHVSHFENGCHIPHIPI